MTELDTDQMLREIQRQHTTILSLEESLAAQEKATHHFARKVEQMATASKLEREVLTKRIKEISDERDMYKETAEAFCISCEEWQQVARDCLDTLERSVIDLMSDHALLP